MLMRVLRRNHAGLSGSGGAAMVAAAVLILATSSLFSPSRAATLVFPDPFYRLDRLAWFPEPQCNAELSGKIYVGDAEEMKAKLEAFWKHPAVESGRNRDDSGISRLTLCLDSPGGDLPEAIRIGELFRGWNTVVPAHASCASACAVIFMHALDGFSPFNWPTYVDTSRRYLHVTATLGFHAPDLLLPKDGPETMSRQDAVRLAGEMYRRALASIRSVVVGSNAERDSIARARNSDDKSTTKSFVGYGHFARARFPTELLLAMLTTPHEDMYTITTIEEALNWGIDIFGLPPPRALTGNMLLMACYNHLHIRCQQGTLNWQCPFESDRFESGHDTSQASRAGDWYKTAWEEDRTSLRRLWPRGEQKGSSPSTTVHLFRLQQTSVDEKSKKRVPADPALCAVEAAWNGPRLVSLEIQTMNGNAQESIQAKYAMTAERVKYLLSPGRSESGNNPDQLRPWRMLPTGTKLKELAGPNPWGWLGEGGNFFDKAPGW
jgi:hypothetical protein